MATIVRQPFGELSSSRVQQLASAKNRQNGNAHRSPHSTSPSTTAPSNGTRLHCEELPPKRQTHDLHPYPIQTHHQTLLHPLHTRRYRHRKPRPDPLLTSEEIQIRILRLRETIPILSRPCLHFHSHSDFHAAFLFDSLFHSPPGGRALLDADAAAHGSRRAESGSQDCGS